MATTIIDVTPDPEGILTGEPPAAGADVRRSSAWDISNAPRNYVSLIVTQAGSAVFSFASVWLLTHYLGGEGYGGVVAVIAASQLAQVLINWTAVAVVRFGVDEFIDTAKIARTFWVRLAALAINLAIVIAASIWWFPPLAGWLKIAPETYWLVVGHLAITAIWVHLQMSLQAAKMLRLQGFMMMIERLLIMLGIIVLLTFADLSSSAAVVCYIAAPLAMIAVGSVVIRKYIFAGFSPDGDFFRKLFAYSLPLLPMAVVGYIGSVYIDAVFISSYLSTADLGVYSVATQVNGVLLQVPTLANTLLLPLFVTLSREEQMERLRKFFDRILPVLTLGWGLACTLFAFAAAFLIPLVFRPEFQASVVPLWILAVSSGVALPALVGYQALGHSISATNISLWATVCSAIAKVAFNILLIGTLGIVACAWSTLAAFAAAVLVSGVLLQRRVLIRLSWTNAAMVPVVLGGLAVWATGNIWLGLAGVLVPTALLGLWLRDAAKDLLVFLDLFPSREA
jgi:O-antigen/teichoic acid export membrane protein